MMTHPWIPAMAKVVVFDVKPISRTTPRIFQRHPRYVFAGPSCLRRLALQTYVRVRTVLYNFGCLGVTSAYWDLNTHNIHSFIIHFRDIILILIILYIDNLPLLCIYPYFLLFGLRSYIQYFRVRDQCSRPSDRFYRQSDHFSCLGDHAYSLGYRFSHFSDHFSAA